MFTNWKKIRGLGPRRRLTLASARSDLASLSVTFHFIRNFVSLQSPSHIYRCAWISEIVVEHRICVTRMSVCVLLQRWLYLLFLSWVEVWNIVSVPSDQIFISLLLFFFNVLNEKWSAVFIRPILIFSSDKCINPAGHLYADDSKSLSPSQNYLPNSTSKYLLGISTWVLSRS